MLSVMNMCILIYVALFDPMDSYRFPSNKWNAGFIVCRCGPAWNAVCGTYCDYRTISTVEKQQTCSFTTFVLCVCVFFFVWPKAKQVSINEKMRQPLNQLSFIYYWTIIIWNCKFTTFRHSRIHQSMPVCIVMLKHTSLWHMLFMVFVRIVWNSNW